MVPRIRTSGASQTPRLRRLASKLCQGEHMGARRFHSLCRFHSLKWPFALYLATGVFMHSSYAETIGFDTDAVGSLPDSWVEGVTGRGTPRWTVESDASAPSKPNVLKQSGAGTFPWCVRHRTSIEDGFVEVKFKALAGTEDRAGGVVPAYLLALGLGQLEVGFISTARLFGSALATLAVGRWGHRFSIRRLLLGTSLLMAATGLAFAGLSSLWPLLIVAFVGTLNPSSGDVSVFLPLDHTLLAAAAPADARTSVFARYSFAGSLCGAIGALAAAAPEWLAARGALSMLEALRAMFVLYGAVGVAVWAVFLRLPDARVEETKPAAPLGPSRGMVWRLAGLFSVDSFAGGLVVNSLLALWLFERFGMSLTAAGGFFFLARLLHRAVHP